ncbi:MAG TPA: Crp/Fnr family transcriptional regulator [Bradyrhizobium sp.]|uniref:Crp/Fnr family transcriptional regulator n=1 Tax=Bradyrhizobium sp. TaxID=376 RepID=UPI002D7E555A|nr:Crp/Fnr family transcriptional regulator [Bradyrhizobium sp.]HET7887506.1 Crp/Fnr family transcriptional regulator [Bradyrhizobium sp.]
MPSRGEGGGGEPIIRRLNALRRLSDAGASAIRAAVRDRTINASTGEDIACEGERCDTVRLFLSGWACRYKALEDGRRQIVNFVLPGDSCDAFIYLLSGMDHSLATLSPVTYAELDRGAFERLLSTDVSVAEAFQCEVLAARAIQREWTINLGRRDALERVAHLICEMFERLRVVGLTDGNSFAFPVTQTDLADATGLSTVHLNRTLQQLRAERLIGLKERTLTILDVDALRNAAMFNPTYLHLTRG